MPKVPRLDEAQVRESGMPDVRFNTNAPREAFGGGPAAAAAGQEARGLAKEVADFAIEERRSADSLVIQQADLETAQEKLRLLKDPKTGALNTRGQESLALPDTVNAAFESYTDKVKAGLTASQRPLYDRAVIGHKRDINDTLQTHIFGEMRKFDEASTKARMETAREEAALNFTNPDKVQVSVNLQAQLLRARADRDDLAGVSVPPEELDRQIKEASSKTYLGVIQRMVNSGATPAANSYYKSVKKDITAEDADVIDRALHTGMVTGESQRQATEIFQSNPGDQKTALSVARAIEDPEIQKATVAELKTRYAEDEALSAKSQEDAMRLAIKITNNGAGVGAVPQAVLATLTEGNKQVITDYANKVRTNTLQTDKPLYYGLKMMAIDRADREAFKNEDLTRHRANLADKEYNELTALQDGVRKDSHGSRNVLDGIRTSSEIINTTLNSIGVDPTPKPGTKDAQKVAEFRDLVDEHARRLEHVTGKPATPKDVKTIVDNLTIETKKAGWFSPARRAFEKAARLSDVPPAARLKIEASLKSSSIPITNDEIIEAYNRGR